jgi:hypothetical protein
VRLSLAVATVAGCVGLLQPEPVEVSRLGPQVGARAIDFSLKDQRGLERSIRSVAGPKGTMLVFFRSADW